MVISRCALRSAKMNIPISKFAIIIHEATLASSAWFYVAQLLNLTLMIAWPILLYKGVSIALRRGSGSEVPLWIIVVVIFPIFGGWIALTHLGKKPPVDIDD